MSAVEELLEAVRGGLTAQVPGLLAGLDEAGRRAALAAVKELRRADRGSWSTAAVRRRGALLVAGAGLHGGPAGAADWIGAREYAGSGLDQAPLSEVIAAQDPAWQIEVVTRLSTRRGTGWRWEYYEVVDRVLRRTGCPPPPSDGYLTEWLRRTVWEHSYTQRQVRPLVDRLRADPLTPELVRRFFELAEVDALVGQYRGADGQPAWPRAIASLAASKDLDRAELLDGCTSRLLRGTGRAGDQRVFLAMLVALVPTPEELAARARDLVALLDAASPVAGWAQQALGELDEAGLVEPGLVEEASATVLFRSEKKLVRTQLGQLDRIARRDPERAGPVLLAVADAFSHPDSALQERALNLVARHLKRAGDAVLPALRDAAEGLNPAHHARAGELLGAPVGGDPGAVQWQELLPPAPVPHPLDGPIATPAEVAEELSALLVGEAGVADFERVLDGLVRHARPDRAALAEALEPVLRVHTFHSLGRWEDCGPEDVLYVAEAVAGRRPVFHGTPFGRKDSPLRGDRLTAFGRVTAMRLEEAAWQAHGGRVPMLLATPTDATGALAAAALVERLAAYEEAGAVPGEADLNTALLRLAPTADPAVLAAADRLGSPAGRWAARWLREGGLPAQPSERVEFAPGTGARATVIYGERWWEALRRTEVGQPGPGAVPCGPDGEHLHRDFLALLERTEPSVSRVRALEDWLWEPTAHWAALLPHHREELAARWLDWFAGAADRDQADAPLLLPVLAEAGGPAGLALHLALAYGLGARFPDDRAAAVDALLVLAARGQLDGPLLGRELAGLVGTGTVKPNRLAQSLLAAAETGACATVWSVLAPALPGLLAGEATRGLGEVLAVAVDCARRTGARGPVEGVDEVAARTGSSRLVKEARTLREVLAG